MKFFYGCLLFFSFIILVHYLYSYDKKTKYKLTNINASECSSTNFGIISSSQHIIPHMMQCYKDAIGNQKCYSDYYPNY